MSAHFSALYQQSSGLVQWSPDGRYVATAVGQKLAVRDAANGFEIVKGGLRPCLDKIEGLEWASDSDLILCAFYKRALVEAFSVSRPDWQCRIREGMAGMVKAQWTPDARHVVTFSDYSLHMTVWSLSTREMHTVRQPKAAPGCIAFSPDSLVMAVATRRDCRDHVRLYDATTWESLGGFTAETLDLVALEWSPDGTALCLQDTPLEYRVLFYSPAGELLGKLEAYSNALGVKSLAWSPDGSLLSIGSYDQCARLVSAVNWKPVAALRHVHPKTQPGFEHVAFYREVPLGQEDAAQDEDEGEKGGSQGSPRDLLPPGVKRGVVDKNLSGAFDRAQSSFSSWRAPASASASASVLSVLGGAGGKARRAAAASTLKPRISSKDVDITYSPSLPSSIPSERPDPTKPYPRLGVGQIMSWSLDGRYLATRNDNMPSVLWVWDAGDLGLSSVVVQMDAIRSAKWCPARHSLAICTGNHHVYLWSPEGASWVDVPSDGLEILGFRWSPDGSALLLLTRDNVCCCYLADPDLLRQTGQSGEEEGDMEEEHDREDDVDAGVEGWEEGGVEAEGIIGS